MKPSLTIAWVLVAVAVSAGAAAWVLRPGTTSDAVQADVAPLVRTLRFSARIAALSRVEAGSTVTGRVEKVHVREGDRVRAGQLLVALDAAEARAALAQARAAERQAQARVAQLDGTSIAVAQAQLHQAEATLANATSEWRRARELVQQGFISASRLDDNRRAMQVAQAQRDAARAQLDSVGRQGGEGRQALAQWEAARAASATAAARLEQTELRAPSAATVLTRLAEPGQIVQPGKPLVGLALDGPTLVVAQVDERFLEQLQVGQQAAVRPDAQPDLSLPARVTSLAPQVDAQKGAVEVKLAFTAPLPATLREDMTVSVEVVTGSRPRALVLPAIALRRGANAGETVFVADGGRARARPVKTGLRTTDAVEITEGLVAGEKVLLARGLVDGQRVKLGRVGAPVPAAGASAAADEGGLGAALAGGMRP